MAKQPLTEKALNAMGLTKNEKGQYESFKEKPHIYKKEDISYCIPIGKKADAKAGDTIPYLDNIRENPAILPIRNSVWVSLDHNEENYIKLRLPEPLVFQWADKHISLNDWYSSKHWTQRNNSRNKWHTFFKSFLTKPLPKFKTYKVILEYNSRLDPSNTITMIKLCEDMLQEEGVINNDNKDNCKGIEIIPNLIMKKKSYRLIIKHP